MVQPTMAPRFYFATCQIGSEKAVKAEVLSEFEHLRFAFSRPGFITFKEENSSKPEIQETHGIFTRLWGMTIGQSKDPAALEALLKSVPEGAIIHRFDRDLYSPGDEPESYVQDSKIQALVPDLKDGTPKVGDRVYDLIWIDENHVFLGSHTHLEHLDPSPGNRPKLEIPADSPSRAYVKIEEAFHRFKPEIKKGMLALEVGFCPGGATLAMLSRGIKVVGVDPKDLHERLSKEKNFRHIQKYARNVTLTDLEAVNPDWIVVDMSIAPHEALDELDRVMTLLKKNFGPSLKIRCGFLTLKLNSWKFADGISAYLKRLKEMGFRDLVPLQLATNRQEFFVMARGFKA